MMAVARSELARMAMFCAAVVFLSASSACATRNYMGISLQPGAADAAVQALALRARAGDKRAQLELGTRFEEGFGLPQDPWRAEQLYRLAAADSGGPMWIYSPSPGGGAPGRVMPIDMGPKQAGLDEAKARLRARQ